MLVLVDQTNEITQPNVIDFFHYHMAFQFTGEVCKQKRDYVVVCHSFHNGVSNHYTIKAQSTALNQLAVDIGLRKRIRKRKRGDFYAL